MKKVLLIGDSPLRDSPYIQSYIEVLVQNSIPYDLLFWNRHLDSTEHLPENFIPYNLFTDNNYPSWKRLYNIWKFASFASRWMSKNDYAYVVVFTIAHAIFMSRTLQKRYKNKYIFDIRDYSPLCKIGLFRKTVEHIIEEAAFTVVSSVGFLRWLPKGEKYRYVISHNTTQHLLESAKTVVTDKNPLLFGAQKQTINILTIGQISYFSSQQFFVDKFANKDSYTLSFIGVGPASVPLKEYVEIKNIQNVSFGGRYEKKDETEIVKPFHMINIWLKHDINADSCMANRFYLSVQTRKPMIVSKNSYQGELCEKYGLGVVLEEEDDFIIKIKEWWLGFDVEKYNAGCMAFMDDVQKEMELFQQEIVNLYRRLS